MTKAKQQSGDALSANCPRAHLIRRLGAYLIDLITVSVLLLLATVIAVLIVITGDISGLINLSAYQSIAEYLAQSLVFAAYLAMLTVAFTAISGVSKDRPGA